MRKTVFISHAAPADNDFARWLSLQLIGMGYQVWCDVLKLKGGEDWWPLIENEIRENTIKFVLVLSKKSNTADGVLKELAVAQKVKKKLIDDQFIVPLHVDTELSYDEVNIELNRLNSIDFKQSWATGLQQLLELLEEQNVVKSETNFDHVNELWQTIHLKDKHPIQEPEVYFSNWFPIIQLPEVINFHRMRYAIPKGFDVRKLPFPAVPHKNCLVTFAWCYDFIDDFPKSETYDQSETVKVPTEEILSGTYGNNFISNFEARRLIIQLLNQGFDRSIVEKNVEKYEMSHKLSFWVKKGVLEKDKIGRIQLVGKQKEKNWHFGISGSVKMFPERSFLINTHIWFTSDGENLIPEASKQHSARRKQGKNWWNNDWRNKVMAFMKYLEDEDGAIHLILGGEETAKISTQPIMFESPVTYIDPNKENLPEEEVSRDDDIEGDNVSTDQIEK